MRSFFKIFFASCLSLVVFFAVLFFLAIGAASNLTSRNKTDVADNSVLLLDLGKPYTEQAQPDPIGALSGDEGAPGLYDVVRLLQHAAEDDKISGLYIIANNNPNGFASSEELRNAVLQFKRSKKFVYAYGEVMSQQAYHVANAAGKLYVNPKGGLEWQGFAIDIPFLKGTLDKLGIEPQVFYAGKFKSATEPFRFTKMTPENKLQTIEWLGDMYQHFLRTAASARGTDTATLQNLANTGAIQTADDAVRYKLIDGVRYDDEVKEEIKRSLDIKKEDKIQFLSLAKYADAADYKRSGDNRIALIYASGDIVDGNGSRDNIGSTDFINTIRKARLDKSIKAVVFRINSGGGSALASENIWRELALTKKAKPVIVSFGDVAASGGYYIAAAGDSIFCQPNTITGSIGVFGLLPNMEKFFNDKLGVTFDGVKTAELANTGAVYRPLNETEKRIIQSGVERTYQQFKQRVADGRKKDTAFVETIAQGRVWSGQDALRLGLVDGFGGLDRAISAAAKKANITSYRLRELPEKQNWLDDLLDRKKTEPAVMLKEQLGQEAYQTYQQLIKIKELTGSVQARMPFQYFIR